jgi:hypothetical protein
MGKKMFGDEWASYKNHNVIHISDDAVWMQVHLDALAAYPFENMQRLFTNVSIASLTATNVCGVSCIYNYLFNRRMFSFSIELKFALHFFQLLRSGKNPISQIARGLAIYRRYKSSYVQNGKEKTDEESLEAESDRIRESGRRSLALPGMSLKKLVHVKRSKTSRAFCHSSTLSNK